MTAFEFATSPRVIVQPGAMLAPDAWLSGFAAQRVFMVTDLGVLKAGLIAPIQAAITATGRELVIFHEVEADPPVHRVEAAVAAARAAKAELILGVGGGSSLDTAKLVALLAATPQALSTIYGIGLAKGPRLPLIQVPTTAGTGSEVTSIAIVTTDTQEKKGVVSPLLYPDLAILDADLTLCLPPAVTAMTGIDAMVHAIEAYTSRHKKNPISDSLAREGLRLLALNLPRVLANGADREARSAMLTGAMMAGMAFANAPVAAVHALAYPLGGHFHVPHGLSNALVLAPVLRFNLPAAEQAYAELAMMLPDAPVGMNTRMAAEWFVERMSALVAAMPFAQRLSEVGVSANDLDRLTDDAMKIERLLINNPREMTRAAAHAIYSEQL